MSPLASQPVAGPLVDPHDICDKLATGPPQPVSDEERSVILTQLPQQEQVRDPDPKIRRKLHVAREALKRFDREHTYEFVIMDISPAYFGLHARTVVLVSKPALAILSAEEVGAMVAHEAAHEYLWAAFQRARSMADLPSLNRIELQADAIAIVRMHGTPMNGSVLMKALQKIALYNKRFGEAKDAARYPALASRFESANRILRWVSDSVNPCARHDSQC